MAEVSNRMRRLEKEKRKVICTWLDDKMVISLLRFWAVHGMKKEIEISITAQRLAELLEGVIMRKSELDGGIVETNGQSQFRQPQRRNLLAKRRFAPLEAN